MVDLFSSIELTFRRAEHSEENGVSFFIDEQMKLFGDVVSYQRKDSHRATTIRANIRSHRHVFFRRHSDGVDCRRLRHQIPREKRKECLLRNEEDFLLGSVEFVSDDDGERSNSLSSRAKKKTQRKIIA